MIKIRQVLLLIWKNFKLQQRHPWVTVTELCIPVFFSAILVFLRSIISSDYVTNPTIYQPFNINELPRNLTPKVGQWHLLYTPTSTFLDDLMNMISKDLNVKPKGFTNEEQMENHYNNATASCLAGIVFSDDLISGVENVKNISYTIRPQSALPPDNPLQSTLKYWYTDIIFPNYPALGPRNPSHALGGNPGYMEKGFLPIQHTVAMNFMKKLDSNFPSSFQNNVLMNRYPYPPFLDDKFVVALAAFFPMVICFSFIYPASNLVKNIVVEKESKIKEAMKMMGLSRWLHWTAWYLKSFIFLFFACCIITMLLCIRFTDNAVINLSSPSLILLWLTIYTLSFIPFCFFVSTLFNKANSAAAGSGVIFFLTFVPYFFLFPRYQQLSYGTKIILCLLPNLALSMGSMVLTTSEAFANGLQWNNFSDPPSPDSDLSMITVLAMFIVDGIIFLALTWYVEAVFPGEFGVPERWYFCFTREYWCGHSTGYSELEQVDPKHDEFFEQEPIDLMPGIQIHNLTKMYGKKGRPAVNNISINMYRGQITALLGHNGAGKTTTISMLTGLITPTSGTALVNGFDICDDIDSVHSSLGICPQHDILFNELTVEEHLYFFCKLKGYISDLVASEIERIISILSLEPYRKFRADALSGGWKRKVSVGIAFVGGSRIVILDEPTSGMDPFNRRALWEVLHTEKEDRTILLTTHFMEEADALGDRIAIMADGEIQCCGSAYFLKKKYGAGYHLVMVKEPDCDVLLITKTILHYIPHAEEMSNIGGELKYILPVESSHQFSDLFGELDNRREELKISSYGASITTMEEVFIKVGKKVSVAAASNLDIPLSNKESGSTTDSGIHVNAAFVDDAGTEVDLQSLHEYSPTDHQSGWRLYFQHLQVLLWKRILHSFRNVILTLSQLILPPLFLILTLIIVQTLPKPKDAPALFLTSDSYLGTQIPYYADSSTESTNLSRIFASQFSSPDEPVSVNFDMNRYLLEQAGSDLGKYNMHNMLAAKFDGNTLTSLFNNQAYHSPAIALLSMDNTILKFFKNVSYTFAVTNHPMPRTLEDKGKQEQTQATESYQIAQDIMFGMSFLMASFAVFLVKERASNSKHLQRVSGMSLSTYWLASYIWDFINYLIPCCLLMLVFLGFQTKGFSTSVELGRLFILLLLHGFAALPFVYCCSFPFIVPSTAYVRISLFNTLAGIACLLAVTLLEIPELGVQSVGRHLSVLFSAILPNFALGRGVSNLYQNNQFNKYCNQPKIIFVCETEWPVEAFEYVKPCCKGKCGEACIPWESNYFSIYSPGIGTQLISFVVQAIGYTIVLILCEKNIIRFIKYQIEIKQAKQTLIASEAVQEAESFEDDDVCRERMKIENTTLQNLFATHHVIVKDILKRYGSFTAVDKISFGVQKGECFGLLGSNGAGKTTTFKMITGELSITSGDIYVDGYDIKKQSRKVQGRIGYCPQFDALIDELTGRETLTLFCRLRGIPKHLIERQIKSYSELLSFSEHIDKLVKYYSGGNKRKLSTAVALIGDSPVIFLDEPSTGMDPVARRCIWRAILQVMKTGRSVILTSHSMEECEALCTRLVIMVNGKFCCLGSPQHLKTKFGEGFSLTVKVGKRPDSMNIRLSDALSGMQVQVIASDPRTGSIRDFLPTDSAIKTDISDVINFVKNTFVSATLRSTHENQLHFHIPSTRLNWAEIFGVMERAKSDLNIEDYTVGETTLEQVFLNFALAQKPAHED